MVDQYFMNEILMFYWNSNYECRSMPMSAHRLPDKKEFRHLYCPSNYF